MRKWSRVKFLGSGIALIVVGVLTAKVLANDPQSLDDIRKDYFKLLNYDDAQIAEKIPEYEAQLFEQAEKRLKNLDRVALKSRQEGALVIAYAAMYMRNTLDAVAKGRIDSERLIKFKRFASSGSSLGEELEAREKYLVFLLEKAHTALKDDPFLHSIWMANQMGLEKMQRAKAEIREKTIRDMLALLKRHPDSFLFSTIIGHLKFQAPFSNEQKRELLSFGDRWLSKKRDPKQQPSTERPTQMKSHALRVELDKMSAFRRQGAMLILGDLNLSWAEGELAKGNLNEETFKRLKMAQGFYQSLMKGEVSKQTESWIHAPLLKKRTERAGRILKNRRAELKFWDSQAAINAYSCTACH